MLSAKKIYKKLEPERRPYLDRARECAAVTIPSLFPEEGHTGQNSNPNPNQSFAAECVNTLASKMLIGLFPPNVPFFRQSLAKTTQMELTQGNPDVLREILKILGMIEIEATSEAESLGWRPVLENDLMNNVVGGNYLLHFKDDGRLKGFDLTQYVTKRTHQGDLLDMVLEEKLAMQALPDDLREKVQFLRTTKKVTNPQVGVNERDDTVHLYTHVERKGDKFRVYQEMEEHIVPDSEGTYRLERNPWIASRWRSHAGEHYGRSMVEDYYGDLNAFDVISKAIREAVAIGARTVILRRPGGLTKARDIVKAENGDVINGRDEDVSVLKVDKQVDLAVAERFLDRLEGRLSRAFLSTASARRDAERVTLGEIRYMVAELNEALGGVYAMRSQEVQHPLAVLHLHRMQSKSLLPKLPDQATRLSIVTGLEALSREQELQNLHQGLKTAADILGPDVVAQFTDPANIIQRIFTALRIDPDGAIKTPDQVSAEQQQNQAMALIQQLGPEGMKLIQSAMQNQGNPNGQAA